MVSDTADIICQTKADCMLLLQHMKWDDQKLKGLYFDKEATVRNASKTLHTYSTRCCMPQIRREAGVTAGDDPPKPPAGVPCVSIPHRSMQRFGVLSAC